MNECPSRFSLVRLSIQDLSEKETKLLDAHVASCPSCQEMIENIEANRAEYEAKANAHHASLVASLESISEKKTPTPLSSRKERTWTSRRALIAFGSLAAAATIVWMLSSQLFQPGQKLGFATTEPGMKFKGTITFEVVAKREKRQFKVEPDAVLLPDDALRFVVNAASPGYLAVFSVDDQNHIYHFYPNTDPDENPEPLLLEEAGRHELPGSIILDAVKGYEHYIVVFSNATFDRRNIAVSRKREMSKPEVIVKNTDNLSIQSLRVKKGAPHEEE